MTKRVSFAFSAADDRGKHLPLFHWLPVYGGLSGERYKDFGTWIS